MEKFEITLAYTDGHIQTDVATKVTAIRNRLADYVYNVTEENKSKAKTDAAKLRKVATASKAERSRIKNQILEDWKEPESLLMALEKDLEATAKNLADGVKAFDDIEKNQKKKQIEEVWINISSAEYPLDIVWSEKFLNKTYKLEDVFKDIKGKYERLQTGWQTLEKMIGDNSEHHFMIYEMYHKTGDMPACIVRLEELQRASKKAQEPENTVIEVQYPEEKEIVPDAVSERENGNHEKRDADEIVCRMFFCKGTPEQFKALSDFMKKTGMEVGSMVKGNQSLNRLYKRSYGEVKNGANRKESKTIIMSDAGWIKK